MFININIVLFRMLKQYNQITLIFKNILSNIMKGRRKF